MKNITAPSTSHLKHHNEFTELINRKHTGELKTRLTNLSCIIRQRYKTYLENKEAVEKTPRARRTNKSISALESCYTNSKKFKTDHTEKVDDKNPKPRPRCPYCQIGFADTFDHFLPSSRFPDFFVFEPNLIRVCGPCNEKKGDKTVSAPRGTLHPYFDDLNTKSYIKCKLTYEDGVLAANFYIDPDKPLTPLETYIHPIAKRHFDYYDLNNHFRAEASGKLTELKREVRTIAQITAISPTIIQIILQNRISNERAKFGSANSWELALWEELLKSPDTETYLTA